MWTQQELKERLFKEIIRYLDKGKVSVLKVVRRWLHPPEVFGPHGLFLPGAVRLTRLAPMEIVFVTNI